MARPKKQDDDLAALSALESKLNEQLADIGRRKAAAQDKARDAGRGTLLAALERVKIGSMDNASARTIAKAIAAAGGDALAAQLSSGSAHDTEAKTTNDPR